MIKKILVLTDFSESSRLAFEWACLFAGKLDAAIHVYHRIEPPEHWEKDLDGGHHKAMQAYVSMVEKKLEELKTAESAQAIEVTASYSSGHFIEQVEELMTRTDTDLIVMGARGTDLNSDKPMGFHTAKAVRRLRANMLIVPETAQPKDIIREVLFTSGLNESDRPAFKWLVKLMPVFGMEEMHIMSVNTGNYFSQPTILMEEALGEFAALGENLASGIDVRTHFYKNNSVLAGILAFGKEEDVDLIAIPNHEKHPLKRIFLGSTVETLVQVSDAPVLCIDLG